MTASAALRLLYADEQSSEVGSGASDFGGPSAACYPLTLPITIDPGALALVVAISAKVKHDWFFGTVEECAAVTLAFGLVALSVVVCYRYCDAVIRWLGTTGADLLARIFALLLPAIGVSLVVEGLVAWSIVRLG